MVRILHPLLTIQSAFFWYWFVPVLIALSLFFSISTHLRTLTNSSVGPGEILISIVALVGFFFFQPRRQFRNPVLWFWVILLITMTLGSYTGQLHGNWVVRNSMAYLFTGISAIGFIFLLSRMPDISLRRTILLLCLIAACSLWGGFAIYLSADLSLINLLKLNDIGDLRYSGWSENPNQLALLFIPLPVWLAALWREVSKPKMCQKLGFGFLLFALMLMGLLVRSDGLLVVWIFEFVVLMFLRIRWDRKVQRSSLLGYAVTMVFCLLLVKTFAHGEVRKSFQCAAQHIVQGLNPWVAYCGNQGHDSEKVDSLRIGYSDPIEKTGLRQDLWKNGLKAWRVSPLFGHGPGAYSWYSDSEIQKAAVSIGKFRDESHNITIDLLTQGGVLLAAAWVALLLYILTRAWRIHDSYTFSVVLMLAIFTMFHYHLRQPFMWFELILSYEAVRRRLFVEDPVEILA